MPTHGANGFDVKMWKVYRSEPAKMINSAITVVKNMSFMYNNFVDINLHREKKKKKKKQLKRKRSNKFKEHKFNHTMQLLAATRRSQKNLSI